MFALLVNVDVFNPLLIIELFNPRAAVHTKRLLLANPLLFHDSYMIDFIDHFCNRRTANESDVPSASRG
ncbi:hypothetical protein Y032_0760g2117 [Ancylostoma ceylanicum]|uniref:Uncharacterized protein n=1 Tax=Ancylostoma ceylanicum TaxID=53326 RepID=A0A016WDE1_9BILA|nr:hypothetical protein Y032_0760g2117 [Ancylostoma ceylanicum]